MLRVLVISDNSVIALNGYVHPPEYRYEFCKVRLFETIQELLLTTLQVPGSDRIRCKEDLLTLLLLRLTPYTHTLTICM